MKCESDYRWCTQPCPAGQAFAERTKPAVPAGCFKTAPLTTKWRLLHHHSIILTVWASTNFIYAFGGPSQRAWFSSSRKITHCRPSFRHTPRYSNNFNPLSAEIFLYTPRDQRVFSTWKHHKSLSYPYSLYLNISSIQIEWYRPKSWILNNQTSELSQLYMCLFVFIDMYLHVHDVGVNPSILWNTVCSLYSIKMTHLAQNLLLLTPCSLNHLSTTYDLVVFIRFITPSKHRYCARICCLAYQDLQMFGS